MLLALAIAGLFVLPQPWSVIVLGVAAVIEVGEVYFWIHFLRRYRVQTGAEGMAGERGEAIEACDPRGLVRVRGEIWSARAAAEPIAAGSAIRVSAVEELTLVVEPDPEGGRPRLPSGVSGR